MGAEIAFLTADSDSAPFWLSFCSNALTVGLGELLACYVLGSILLSVFYRSEVFRSAIDPERLSRLRGFSPFN